MSSNNNLGEVFSGGATTSQHVDAEDEDHFENTTFKLKRTRSIGVLDEFIQPSQEDKEEREENKDKSTSTNEEHNYNTEKFNNDRTEAESSPNPQLPVMPNSPDFLPHDDTDLAYEPSRHVDYLSYQWDVSDISKSWRYVISKRKDVANAARLENASWRTWAQRRSNLKTISPEVVNWSKDSDVTWLYGPILKDDDHGDIDEDDHKRSTTATSAVAGDISLVNKKQKGPKPILKRRTVQDMMISHSNLLKLQSATNRIHQQQQQKREKQLQGASHQRQASAEVPEFDDYDAISAKLNSQYKNVSNQNSSQSLNKLAKGQENPNGLNSELGSVSKFSEQSQSSLSESSESVPEKRRIHFNDQVQQCIAIDENYTDESYDEASDEEDEDYYNNYSDEEEGYIYENPNDYDESDDDYDEDGDEDDEGGFFLNVRSPTTPTAAPGLIPSSAKDDSKYSSEDSKSISTTNSKSYKTIQLLEPTTLNYGTSDEESDEENPYTSSLSHNINNSSKGYDYYYDYNTVYTCDPNHSIYGSHNQNALEVPDVLDVPENITMGSNFDYEIIENEDFKNTEPPILDPVVIHGNSGNYNRLNFEEKNIPQLHTNTKKKPFQLSDSEDDSDAESDEGLSIGTRNSSHSLAQSVFAQPLSSMGKENSHFPESFHDEKPVESSITSINPRHSSASISRQPHSSSVLSDQFFKSPMTENDASSKSLSDQFFNSNNSNESATAYPPKGIRSPSQESLDHQKRLSSTQSKSSPLPPHITSANAFSGGSITPPIDKPPSRRAFMFDSEDESEDEFIEDIDFPDKKIQTLSYSSLSHVADKNGIKSPSPDCHESEQSSSSNSGKTIVNQAKGLANQLLSNWKNNES